MSWVDLEEILTFIFPTELQHPLAASRLFIYSEYGPLVNGELRSGPARRHILSVWELDCMCMQCEREDVIQIYLSRKRDFGILTSEEHESIIQQADNALKKAKGKGMLPALKKDDIILMFKHLQRNEDGLLSFHEIQKEVATFREHRIKEYKLMYPSIAAKPEPFAFETKCGALTKRHQKRSARVSTSVAPATMFLHMKGQTNSEVLDTTNKYLNKFASKITDLDNQGGEGVTANVRLLRDVEPSTKLYEPKPRKKDGKTIKISKWDTECNMRGTGLGSMVNAVPSSTTWKRTTTTF